VDDVRRFDAMQNHVHDGDDVGEGLLFLAVKGAGLERVEDEGVFLAFSAASAVLSASGPSRRFKKSSQEDCSV
jgi:hypothetical protein